MWEVEQKYVVEDPVRLRASLAEQGYSSVATEENCDIYFRHPCRDLRATDEAFRLRTVNAHACVTYKGKRLPGPVKTRPEIELEISPGEHESWLTMLQHLGFVPLPPVIKLRHNFATRETNTDNDAKIQVVLDEVCALGWFAELELIVGAESQLQLAAERIQCLATQLGLATVEPRSYLALTLQKLGLE